MPIEEALYEQTSRTAANFTIGFAKISEDEDVGSVGSGSLASVGLVRGILTAAHVLEALPDEGSVGVILHQQSARPVINMSDAHKLKIGGEASGELGPDLGFLRLPLPTFNSLAARLSVNSLIGRNERPTEGVQGQTSFDAVVGIVSKLTKELGKETPRAGTIIRKFGFEAIFGEGVSGNVIQRDKHDYFEFDVVGVGLPKSYGGVSGGAVLRFYVEEKGGLKSMSSFDVVGVPYFESCPLESGSGIHVSYKRQSAPTMLAVSSLDMEVETRFYGE